MIDLTPLLVSEASRVELPLQHTALAPRLSTSCGVWPHNYRRYH